MKSIRKIWPATIAITIALAAPALAQSRQESRTAEARTDRARNDDQRGQARARAASPRAVPGYGDQGRAVARGRNNQNAVARQDHAVPRAQVYDSRGYGYAPPPRAYGYYDRSYVGVPVVRYPRPYYSFRPRFLIGFGVYIGYPVPYPVAYGYPSYVYGYPYGAYAPSPASYGGISFDIWPDDSAVWVDGQYVGVARNFSPWYQPLTLAAGRHRIELQPPGRPPLAFDVDIMPGEVFPYRGTL